MSDQRKGRWSRRTAPGPIRERPSTMPATHKTPAARQELASGLAAMSARAVLWAHCGETA